jgi:hypothetical protein
MTRFRLLARVLPLLLAGCASDADQVCDNIGLCADQDDPTIALCKAQAAELGDEAFDAGCGASYDSYYSCANGAYTCTGNTPSFPGCETDLGTLDSCLEVAQTSTSCGELARALAACPGADGGGNEGMPPACTASDVCAASCYLQFVSNVCAPLPAQLVSFEACASVCL